MQFSNALGMMVTWIEQTCVNRIDTRKHVDEAACIYGVIHGKNPLHSTNNLSEFILLAFYGYAIDLTFNARGSWTLRPADQTLLFTKTVLKSRQSAADVLNRAAKDENMVSRKREKFGNIVAASIS